MGAAQTLLERIAVQRLLCKVLEVLLTFAECRFAAFTCVWGVLGVALGYSWNYTFEWQTYLEWPREPLVV